MAPCIEPFCIFWKTKQAVEEFEKRLISSQPRTLKMYQQNGNHMVTFDSTDFIYHSNHTDYRLHTAAEYEIALENKLNDLHQINPICHTAFVDVFFGTYFVCRRYVNDWMIVSVAGYVMDWRQDDAIGRVMATRVSLLNRKRITLDFWNRITPMSDYEFYTKYKL